jgi:hypothetical protein
VHASAYFAVMSNRFAPCGPAARSAQQSVTTNVGKPCWTEVELEEVELEDGGDWLLAGEFEADVHVGTGVVSVRERFPPGSPQRPPTHEEVMRKAQECLTGIDPDPTAITWSTAGQLLRDHL